MGKGKWKESMPIQVSIRPGIRCDGEITRVRITQGEEEIQLTRAQAETLVARINEKLGAAHDD